jgi:flagellar basal-body rod protein FlgF
MLYGMYVSAAGALANAHRQDVVANNLANVDTVAFKRDLALFRARKTAAQETGRYQDSTALLEGLGGGVFALPTATDFSPGAMEEVRDPYSVALAGKGFFRVLKDNQVKLTRDGRFTLNQDNQLVTVGNHYPVLNDQGNPIVLDRNLPMTISESGVVSQGATAVGKLDVVDTENPQQLSKDGKNLYTLASGTSLQPAKTLVKQGFTETSGVEPTRELIALIRSQRMYQLNLNMLTMQDQTLEAAVTKLGSVA